MAKGSGRISGSRFTGRQAPQPNVVAFMPDRREQGRDSEQSSNGRVDERHTGGWAGQGIK